MTRQANGSGGFGAGGPGHLHRLTLRQVRAFLITADLGSVAAAAKALGLTQPAVGQQLRELEAQLGVRLFEKVGTRLMPTPAGLALARPARDLLAAVDDLQDAAARFRDGAEAHIRVGTGATACIYFMPTPLERTKRLLPGLQITVTTGNTAEILAGLADGRLEAAIVTAPPDLLPPQFEAELLFDDELLAVVPRRLTADLPPSLRPSDLAGQPLILYESKGATRSVIDAWFHAAAVAPFSAMELGSIEAIKQLVGAGLGCSIIPGLSAAALPPQLVARPLDPPIMRPISLVLRGNKVPDAALRLLIKQLRAAGRDLMRARA